MKIYDVPNNTFVIKNGDTLPIEDLHAQWEDLTIEEKQGWYTTTCERLKIDASTVISYVIERLADNGYEEMDTMLYEQLPEDATKKLQIVLDELFDNTAADVYYPTELIEWEENNE
ncbi:hypothetical protein NX771_02705 [Streptococcus suis]|uniref:hypothetical protein n=1 Tax=Streptococcus suis TaxID=1307 RepID=UPI002162567F|nr:hypothetical protein [Streptococcus suis]MCS0684652.1 hypothetical protein [Streptococcus suis]HEL1817124.1 hypothetical protein [Streptococcus suis]HEL1987907.1 hypothetical protein [Streptococcus suis]HEL2233062.1 hypothetical protein [Streptococcus suis]